MLTFEKPTVWDVLPFDLLTNKLIKKKGSYTDEKTYLNIDMEIS